MKRHLLLLLLGCMTSIPMFAQSATDSVYTYKKLNRSLSFAQLTRGGDVLCMTGGSRLHQGAEEAFGPVFMPRFTIGGLHFWGHADFYVTFPLGITLQQKPGFSSKFKMLENVETGFKIYPAALRPGHVRPYVGMSFQPFQFGYQVKGSNFEKGYSRFERFISPVQVGLTYTTKKYLISAGLRYHWKQQFDYFETPEGTTGVQLNRFNVNIGIVNYIDIDKGAGTKRGVEQFNRMHDILVKNKKLSAWYWGIGPSTALQMSKSPFIAKNYPYLNDNMLNSFLLPDISVGRYFSGADFNVGLSMRTMWFKASAFDTRLRMHRSTAALEAYKFLFNYHGFVPFVGPMVSMEYLQLKTNGVKTAQVAKPAVGIVFGWDIRVTRTATSLLRTNLRYTPGLHLDVAGEQLRFNHLEFNFIQYVHIIGRGKLYRKYSG
jgi:hypothetical protein